MKRKGVQQMEGMIEETQKALVDITKEVEQLKETNRELESWLEDEEKERNKLQNEIDELEEEIRGKKGELEDHSMNYCW